MIKLHAVPQASKEWLELRAGKYTGSNADKLLKFGTIDYSLTEVGSFGGNYWTQRGHILEDQAIEIYMATRLADVQRMGFVTNSKYPKCGYSPDGLLPERLIEVKCFDKEKHLAYFMGDGSYIELKVMAQMQFGMLICEKLACDLIIYNPDLSVEEAFKIIEVKRQPKVAANFRQILKGIK